MDWEESSPPSRETFEKNSSSQSHNQHHNHFHHHRLITTSSGSATTQISYTNGSTSYRAGSHNHHSLNQAINLSEGSKKSGFGSHHHFSSSSANTSPSGSSTSPSPPLILSTSCDSNGSSSNPSQIGTNLTITAASPGQPSPPDTSKPTDSKSSNSNNTSTSSKKNKPIPPPLDLSIGAANLSLHSSEPDSSSPTPINLLHSANPIHGSCVTPHFFQPSYYYLGSPRGNPATEKSLPLRKRWHSWSPLLMNSQIDPMLPLFAESSGNGHNQATSESRNQDQTPTNAISTLSFSLNPPSSPSPWSASTSSAGKPSQPGGASNHANVPSASKSSNKNNSNELQTPTPFYTPNEPSPKFMNSPVFSYSTPDTTLYQGPFSPIRTTTLFPPTLLPSSPFLNSSLNTPTFITNTNGAHTSSNPSSSFSNSLSGTTLTVPIFNGNGLSTASSSPHSTCSSSSTSTNFNPLVPTTLLSPASSQASSSNSVSYEDLHEKSTLVSLNNLSKFNPIWNIFIPGTRIRFLHGISSMDWHLVDVLDMKDDYAPNGLEVKTLVVTSSAKERIQMTFSPVADLNHPVVEVNCEPWHPFMVEKKGWCAINPDIFYETFGIRCQRLECGDVCVKHTLASHSRRSPQQHHQQMFQPSLQSDDLSYNNVLRNEFKMPTFNSPTPPPLDVKPSLDQLNISKSEYKSVSPLANIPISVVRQKAQPTPNPPSNKKKSGGGSSSASKKSKLQTNSQAEPRGRRPMNAFLLFAKDKRPELIQMYPGKDNRSISVLLGEAWQSLGPVEKEKYASNARAKAEEQKRMHPDCWKRKKAQSSTSANANNASSNSLHAPSHKNMPSFSPASMLNFHSHIDEM